ncbi:MAG: hypothetical protein Q8L57_02530 [bacterium]|nr:hypothetical protein [bacterium]
MPQKTAIYNFTVIYEENAKEGARHLREDLSFDEARVFFDQARLRGSAQFEDDEDRQYTLIYQNGVYVLTRR